jgi:formylglycine-generating enzyme required for sulfatase activity
LGEGGMATVYKAFDTRLECEVAIKFIRKENVPSSQWESMIVRFEREAKRMAKFLHPNIVKVIDYGEYQGSPYLVMPYLPGGTVKELLKGRHGKPISYQEAIHILTPVARALEYAHHQDTIHRDVKPANILLTDEGFPLLTDFGVAKILDLDEGQTLTGTGVGVGTPKYMAPEQWQNQISVQTDVYALGIVFYELVTGRVPYDADTPAGVLMKQLMEPLTRPSQFVADLPEGVDHVIYKALARLPEDRYADMGSFAGAMEKLEQGIRIPDNSPETATVDYWLPIQAMDRVGFDKGMTVDTGDLPAKGVRQEHPRKLGRGIRNAQLRKISREARQDPSGKLEVASISSSLPESDEEPQAGETRVREKDGMVMVYIPAGKFRMGSQDNNKDAYDDEKPQHEVYLDGFWIDLTPITNATYRNAVEAGACTKPNDTTYYGNQKYANHPVVNVDWHQAQAYSKWVGGRLPSEAEWEKAARGTDGRTYPWGEGIDCKRANYKGKLFNQVCKGETTAVGEYLEGASPYGVLDMAGNVWEWVNDWYAEDYYQNSPVKNPSGPENGQSRGLRGGSWFNDSWSLRTAYRDSDIPEFLDDNVGFRCAR